MSPQNSASCIKRGRDAFVSKVGKGDSVNRTWNDCLGRRTVQWFLDIGINADQLQTELTMWRQQREALVLSWSARPRFQSFARMSSDADNRGPDASNDGVARARGSRGDGNHGFGQDCQRVDAALNVPQSCAVDSKLDVSEEGEEAPISADRRGSCDPSQGG